MRLFSCCFVVVVVIDDVVNYVDVTSFDGSGKKVHLGPLEATIVVVVIVVFDVVVEIVVVVIAV